MTEQLIDGKPLLEAVIRMETKLDNALEKLEDHEDRLRQAAPKADIDRLDARYDLIAKDVADLKARPVVTPKGLLTTTAASVSVMIGIVALLNIVVFGLQK